MFEIRYFIQITSDKTMFLKNITNIKKTEIHFIFFLVFALLFFALPINNSYAGLECPADWDDCDCDGTCETNVSSDPFNCGACGNVCAGNSCVSGSCASVTGGLVPCGRLSDDPNTTWNEQEDCKICHAILVVNNITDYLIKIAAIIAILMIVIGGILYIFSAGDTSKVTTAKTAIAKSLFGFLVVFIAWVAVNVGMILFGFEDPLGDGSWHKFDCELMGGSITNYYCGDGRVDNPNDDGIAEVCDPKETKSDFIARKTALAVGCADSDGVCPDGCFSDTGAPTDNDCPFAAAAWVKEIYSCDLKTCSFGCIGDPLVDEIGGGCYQPNLADGGIGAACQKGRYICDFNTNTVICQNTYNDPVFRLAGNMCGNIYDYCCDNAGIPFVIDGAGPGGLTAGVDFTIERGFGTQCINFTTPAGAVINNCTGFTCDDICKNAGGKICIGVGLIDAIVNNCKYIQHDIGGNCDLPGNQASTDCRKTFGKRQPGIVECTDSTGTGFNVGETACYCK